MSFLFGKSKSAVVEIPDAEVYPVHALDAPKVNHNVLGWVFRFDDALDADKLKESLCRLLETGDWRKLGGRIRRNAKGKLEIHAPKQFSDEFPAVEYKHDAYADTSIKDHDAGKQFFQKTDMPSIQPVTAEFRSLQADKNVPESVDGLVTINRAQILLHITSFSDATLVGLSVPAISIDPFGFAELLRSWSLVLAGKESEVPVLLDAKTDTLREYESKHVNDDEFLLDKKRITGLKLAKLLARVVWEKTQRSAKTLQGVYLPSTAYKKLLAQIKGDSSTVTDTQAIIAWVSQHVASLEPKPRPVAVPTVVNMRQQVNELRGQGGVTISGMPLTTCAFLDTGIAMSSLGEIAQRVADNSAEQTTEAQMIANLRGYRKEVESESDAARLFGDSDASFILCSPLDGAGMFEAVDFGPASKSGAGKLVSYYSQPLNQSSIGVDALYVLGTDTTGGAWIMGRLAPEVWAKMEEQLKGL